MEVTFGMNENSSLSTHKSNGFQSPASEIEVYYMPDLDDLPNKPLLSQQDGTGKPVLNRTSRYGTHPYSRQCYVAYMGRGNRLVGIDSVSSRCN